MPTSTLVPPLPSHQLLLLILQIGILLLLASVLGRLASRVGLPAVAGELCIGVLLGPTVLGHVFPAFSGWLLPSDPAQFHLLDGIGQLGVLLLVGIIGAEIDLALVRERGTTAVTVGISALLLPLGLGIGVGYLTPDSLIPAGTSRLVFALFLGVALGVSAIPVIAKTLADMHLVHRDVGQLTLAAAMVDDIGGWLLLSVISALAAGSGNPVGALSWSVGRTLLVLLVAVTMARPLIQRSMRWAATRGDTGTPIAVAATAMLLSAAATQALNLEAMFGAFIAGTIIGTAGPEVRARLAPLRKVVLVVLAPIFFATAGLRLDLTALRYPVVLGTAVLVLFVAVLGKFAGAYFGARVSRLGRWEGLALGAGLNSRGVIQIVIATVGLRLGVLTGMTFTIVILVAVVTSLMAPPILAFAMRRVESTPEEELRQQARAEGGSKHP